MYALAERWRQSVRVQYYSTCTLLHFSILTTTRLCLAVGNSLLAVPSTGGHWTTLLAADLASQHWFYKRYVSRTVRWTREGEFLEVTGRGGKFEHSATMRVQALRRNRPSCRTQSARHYFDTVTCLLKRLPSILCLFNTDVWHWIRFYEWWDGRNRINSMRYQPRQQVWLSTTVITLIYAYTVLPSALSSRKCPHQNSVCSFPHYELIYSCVPS
jgi:hypothetical protein